jgi:hypothetical protein
MVKKMEPINERRARDILSRQIYRKGHDDERLNVKKMAPGGSYDFLATNGNVTEAFDVTDLPAIYDGSHNVFGLHEGVHRRSSEEL